MIAQPFYYSRPGSLEEALELLADGSAKPLAGGMSLIPMMKLRLAAPEHLVDLSQVPGLNTIAETNGKIRIGAMATHYEIESSALLRARCPLLAQTAGSIGDVQVRNRGTIGGSLAHADPGSDYPAALLALEAVVHIAGKTRQRTAPYADFLADMFTTTLEQGELVEAIEVPVEGTGTGVSYQKLLQPASGFAIVGVAARITGQAGRIASARIGVTGVSTKAYRALNVEALLAAGRDVTGACEGIAEGVEGSSDIHASARYRLQMARVYSARAIRMALAGLL